MSTVLLVDDDHGPLETFDAVLRGAGFSVVLAFTGKDALFLARQQAIDFVFADLWLTDMTGMDVLKQLREQQCDVPVVIIDFASTAAAIEAEIAATTGAEEARGMDDHLLDLVRSQVPSPSSVDPALSARSRTSPQVFHAIGLIEQRFGEADLSVRSLAHDLGISTEHLCRLLKRQTGRTFVALLRSVRVRAACKLLKSTTLSMKEIADRVGFGSASQFDRAFKKLCGVSPSEYRTRSLAPPPVARPVNFRQAISNDRKP